MIYAKRLTNCKKMKLFKENFIGIILSQTQIYLQLFLNFIIKKIQTRRCYNMMIYHYSFQNHYEFFFNLLTNEFIFEPFHIRGLRKFFE